MFVANSTVSAQEIAPGRFVAIATARDRTLSSGALYDIRLGTVSGSGDNVRADTAMAEANASSPGEKREQNEIVSKRNYPWKRTVAGAIARLFFCNFYYVLLRNGDTKFYFIGKSSNIFTAIEMTKYVIASIDTEAKKSARVAVGDAGGTYWRSFCKGAAGKVYQRCDKIRREAEAVSATATSNGTALVLSSVYASETEANKTYLATLGVELKSSVNRERNTSSVAYYAGREFGDRIGLHNQVSSGSKSTGGKRLT